MLSRTAGGWENERIHMYFSPIFPMAPIIHTFLRIFRERRRDMGTAFLKPYMDFGREDRLWPLNSCVARA